MKVNRVTDSFQEQSLSAEGYDTFFEKMMEICSAREIDHTLGEELKNYATEWLKENSLGSFDNYSDKAYSRTYIGRSTTGWEAIVMGWKRGNRTSIHSHPQFAAYNFADGEFEINCNNPLFEALLREGVTYFPVIMWTTRKSDYDDFVKKYAPYTEFVLK